MFSPDQKFRFCHKCNYLTPANDTVCVACGHDDHSPRTGESWGDWHKRTHAAEALQRKRAADRDMRILFGD